MDNQKGRRNVATKEQQDYIIGKRYEAQKNINRLRDENGVFKSDAPGNQNDDVVKPPGMRTSQFIADREGVGKVTVERNEKFAKGIDAIREVSPELAEKILKPDPAAPFWGLVAIHPKLRCQLQAPRASATKRNGRSCNPS